MAATDTGAAAADIAVLRLEAGDAEGLAPLAHEAGWNQVAADWRLMLELGRGFGVRGDDGRWIASALTLPLGPAVAWISMVLVTAPARGRGLGTRLLERCIAALEADGITAGLDATELGRPIYLPLGFRDVYQLSRWHAGMGGRTAVPPPPGVSIRAARPSDLPQLAAYDAPRSGFARGTILAHLMSRAPAPACLAERSDGTIVGYALGRDGYRALHVGPVVAEDETIGLALLSRALAGATQPMIADVPDCHDAIRRWLADQDATAPRGFMRMVRGPAAIAEAARVYAIAGPELA
jgi:GNAT superfamily N-acetyltransferase